MEVMPMKVWTDPARDKLCDLIDALCNAPSGTASDCFALLEGEPLMPCVDATLSAIFIAASSWEEIDEAVENVLGSCGVQVLCIMASEIPEIVSLSAFPDDGMPEECIADMIESRLRHWFKVRCDAFDFWLSVYLTSGKIATDTCLADGTPLVDICRKLVSSSPATRERARRDLTLTRARGGDVLRYFNYANRYLH
jgi:hypothetical protein